MAKNPIETQPDPVPATGDLVSESEPIITLDAAPLEAPIPAAPWEAEVDAFLQNLLANVSPRVETSIHNHLFAETEALRARLKLLF